jgi:uncharacterized membrane-anchored protein YhcB (DUF1043 family)
MTVFEFAAFVAGVAVGALIARVIGLIDKLWRST